MVQLPNPFTVETYRIFELIDPTEYNALSALNKDVVRIILSMGKVDLNEGSQAQTLLWTIFDENSMTGARLRDESNRLVFVEPPPPEE